MKMLSIIFMFLFPNAGLPALEETSEGIHDLSKSKRKIWDTSLENWDQNNT